MDLHLVHFKVLYRSGHEQLPKGAGWKPPWTCREVVRLLASFDGYRGKYVLHCHNLEHEDMMMANFAVA